ncbi:hypothetical protein QSJ18_10865 [Gordonia sp. ABSL1-1]|uniref:hypothetical protein n=1 Tax=Gordonia sp. ABSL1-1 TaxID=3053923 RepID=UPI0025731164|nr:hypothetical protein [Gordonia sp. ABSL1-1]MDL9937245.1 hypothetical protein [Gordonia sp. ABSL1-1]
MLPVTCRTEYVTPRHIRSAQAALIMMLVAIVALVLLNALGMPGAVIAAVVAGLVSLTAAIAAYGRLGERGAILLTVDEDTCYLGDENRQLVSFPLASLAAVSLEGPAEATTASSGGRRLRVAGTKYLVVTVDPHRADPLASGVEETWEIAVVHTDPAAAEVISRLHAHAPAKVSERAAKVAATPRAAADVPDRGAGGPRVADAGSEDAARRLWEEATRRHDAVLGDYAAYELDPALMLRYPAVTDVSVEETQNFHLALDEATALRTDDYPGDRGRADAYQQSVARLRRAWTVCETRGRKVGVGYLDPADQQDLDTALKLYRHAAGSDVPSEQATYFGRVRDIVTRLADRGALNPPSATLAELESVTRKALEA